MLLKAPVFNLASQADDDLGDGATDVNTLASSETGAAQSDVSLSEGNPPLGPAQSPLTVNAAPPVTVADGATVEIDGVSAQSVIFEGRPVRSSSMMRSPLRVRSRD